MIRAYKVKKVCGYDLHKFQVKDGAVALSLTIALKGYPHAIICDERRFVIPFAAKIILFAIPKRRTAQLYNTTYEKRRKL